MNKTTLKFPPVSYDVTTAAIAAMTEKYGSLRIDGPEDEAGYKMVRTARLDVAKHRTAIEKTRKALKKDALEYGRQVDSAAKDLTEKLLAIETPLKEAEDAYNAELERIKAEILAEREAFVTERVEALAAYGVHAYSRLDLEIMPDAEFEQALVDAQAAQAAEEERMAKEAAAAEERRLEAERLQEERRQLEEEKAALVRERIALEKAKARQEPAPEPEPEEDPFAEPEAPTREVEQETLQEAAEGNVLADAEADNAAHVNFLASGVLRLRKEVRLEHPRSAELDRILATAHADILEQLP